MIITIESILLIFTILRLDYTVMPKIYIGPHQHLQNDGSETKGHCDGSESLHSYSIRFEEPNGIQLRNLIWHWKLLFKVHKLKSYVVPILFEEVKKHPKVFGI